MAAILAIVPGYYFYHSGRAPAVGNEAYTKNRREGNASQEYRDPRDSGVKTLEQKQAKGG